MGTIRLPEMVQQVKQVIRRRISKSNSSSSKVNVPKGCFAIYVGEDEERMKRFVVPVSYLNRPPFQALLRRAEEEFDINHQPGALTIPCPEDDFITVTSGLCHD